MRRRNPFRVLAIFIDEFALRRLRDIRLAWVRRRDPIESVGESNRIDEEDETRSNHSCRDRHVTSRPCLCLWRRKCHAEHRRRIQKLGALLKAKNRDQGELSDDGGRRLRALGYLD